MDGQIIHIAIDTQLISAAKRQIEQKKQFAETCRQFGYSVEQVNQAISDVYESFTNWFNNMRKEGDDDVTEETQRY